MGIIQCIFVLASLHLALGGTISQSAMVMLDITGKTPLRSGGALPATAQFTLGITDQDLVAGDFIMIGSQKPVFVVPPTPFSVLVTSSDDVQGKTCLLTYVNGTANSLTLQLSEYMGSCFLTQSKPTATESFTFTLPQLTLAPNPVVVASGSSSLLVQWWVSATGCPERSYYFSYTAPAIIYAVADLRNADDSDTLVAGGQQPSWMRVGFTPTMDLYAGTVITVQTILVTTFTPPTDPSVIPAIPLGTNGCMAILSSPCNANRLTFTLGDAAGATCKLAANVAVDPSLFRIPANLLSVNPVSTRVSATITVKQNSIMYYNANLNPYVYTTTSGLDPTPSPRRSPNPSPSLSPSPLASASPSMSPNPSTSPFPSASPDTAQRCLAQETLVPKDFMRHNLGGGCDKAGVAALLQQYRCVELQPSCGKFQCGLHVPPSVIQQIQAGC